MKRYILDREFFPAILTSDFEAHPEITFPEKVISETTEVTIPVQLNGNAELEFFIAETAAANNIATFDLTVKFYEATGSEITGSVQTVVVPQTTAGQNQYVAITGADYIKKATKAIVTFTLPFSVAYTAQCFVKGIGSSSDSTASEIIQSNPALLNMTEANSEDILAVMKAMIAVSNSTHKTPGDGSFAFTTNATITTSSFPFTIEDANCRINQISYKPSGDDHFTHLFEGVDGVGFSSAADVITVAGVTPFAAGDEYIVYITEQKKDHDSVNGYTKTAEQIPLSTHVDNDAEKQNVAAANDATFTYYLDMYSYRLLSVQLSALAIGVGTVKVFLSLENNGLAQDDVARVYSDYTNKLYGMSSLIDGMHQPLKQTISKFAKIVIDGQAGAGANAFNLFASKGW